MAEQNQLPIRVSHAAVNEELRVMLSDAHMTIAMQAATMKQQAIELAVARSTTKPPGEPPQA